MTIESFKSGDPVKGFQLLAHGGIILLLRKLHVMHSTGNDTNKRHQSAACDLFELFVATNVKHLLNKITNWGESYTNSMILLLFPLIVWFQNKRRRWSYPANGMWSGTSSQWHMPQIQVNSQSFAIVRSGSSGTLIDWINESLAYFFPGQFPAIAVDWPLASFWREWSVICSELFCHEERSHQERWTKLPQY